MSFTRRTFGTREDLALALSGIVAEELKEGIAARGTAALAVSGGSTPARFLTTLARRADLDWSKVLVTLVDERWVPETSDRSNAALVRGKLLQGAAAAAHFVPLYAGGQAPDAEALGRVERALSVLPETIDVVVFGMGNDGHTASFFPGGDTLAAALSEPGPAIAISAPGAGEPRITLTLQRLLKSRQMYLHIEGEEKARTLEAAAAEGPIEAMPVRAILCQSQTPLTVFWSP